MSVIAGMSRGLSDFRIPRRRQAVSSKDGQPAAGAAVHARATSLLKEHLDILGDAQALVTSSSAELPEHVSLWCRLLLDASVVQGVADPFVMNAAWKTIVLLLRTHRERLPASFSPHPFVETNMAELSQICQLTFAHVAPSVSRHAAVEPNWPITLLILLDRHCGGGGDRRLAKPQRLCPPRTSLPATSG